MTDIVEELENTWVGSGSGTILHDAKIEILRLRKDNKKIKVLEMELNKYIAAFDEAEAKIDEIMVELGRNSVETERLRKSLKYAMEMLDEMEERFGIRGMLDVTDRIRAALDNKTQQSHTEKSEAADHIGDD